MRETHHRTNSTMGKSTHLKVYSSAPLMTILGRRQSSSPGKLLRSNRNSRTHLHYGQSIKLLSLPGPCDGVVPQALRLRAGSTPFSNIVHNSHSSSLLNPHLLSCPSLIVLPNLSIICPEETSRMLRSRRSYLQSSMPQIASIL